VDGWRWTGRRRAVLAVLAVATAWAVAWAGSPPRPAGVLLARLRAATEEAVPDHPWWVRVLSFGLGRLTIPALLLVAAAAVAVLLRGRRWRRAGEAVVVLGGANLTVQMVKHGLVPLDPWSSAPRLSGHMAVVVGAATAVALAVPPRWRRRAVAGGAVAVLLVAVGVVCAWHTLSEMLVPTLLAAAWVLAVVAPDDRATGASRAPGDAVATRS
jgi:hypothetical protein